ncbi:response regulator [Paenibacillus lycopersici]|uniref:Response regulator n=1 Tax=Paenibacillus lycopersici TaxID=2704462 RepID=A0A6C0G784_9BACL|nr:response regulator [Paenibacillus lycopersici]QHT63245.1 response regulator [Paenibacillus lycopersici]
MHILIVDDEPRHLRGMAAMIQSMRPLARVSTAKDGESALACVRSERPDVVLSDIQMPNMNGLAFLKLAAAEGLPAKIVMVSAYDLFEYAQTAIRHGAFDYLLKPIDADKVEVLLERLERQLEAERKEWGESDELKLRFALASPAYRDRLLHLWLSGEMPAEGRAELAEWPLLREATALVLTEAGSSADAAGEPDATNAPDVPAVPEAERSPGGSNVPDATSDPNALESASASNIPNAPDAPSFSDGPNFSDAPSASNIPNAPDAQYAGSPEALLRSLVGQLERSVVAFGPACTFALQTEPGQRSRLVTALCLRQPITQVLQDELRAALQALSASLRPGIALSHGIGIVTAGLASDRAADAADIPQLYRQAQAALAHAFHDEWQGAVSGAALTPVAAPVFGLDGEQLFEALQEPTMASAEGLLRSAFRQLAAGGHTDPKLMKDYAALTVMKIKSRTRDVVDRRIGSILADTALFEIPACAGSGTLLDLLLLRLSDVHLSLTARKQGRSEQIVEQCLAWIQEHYRDDLTLEQAAERFHFNASYFSTLIKSWTGRSFSDHLTEARMRQAKELLAAGQLKIYEIAERCGYRDTKYFTRMFKKQVGLSPEAYKRIPSQQDGNEARP